jgi:hypothetical protein
VSDNQVKDIGIVASTGLADLATLNTFCSGTSCKVTTLYDQSGNGNDMWRADDPNTNQPGTNKPCDLMDIQYWQMSDGTKVPIAVETGAMWKDKSQCLRNRDKTKNMPTGRSLKPSTPSSMPISEQQLLLQLRQHQQRHRILRPRHTQRPQLLPDHVLVQGHGQRTVAHGRL